MTPLSPTALEAAERAVKTCLASKEVSGYINSPNIIATAAITAYLAQAGKEGWVMVPVDRISAIWKEAEDCVPTNWCDGLLTGPKASRVPLDCPAVERLLLGIIKRIRDKAAAAQNGGE